jgi:serine protease Do
MKSRLWIVRVSVCFILLFSFLTISKAEDLDSLRQLSNAFSSISEKVNPSVVSVLATTKIKVSQPNFSPFEDPFFDELRRFFGPDIFPKDNTPQQKEYERSGLGSGVIVTSDGYILTNNHVVAYSNNVADKIKVILSDKREFDAEIKGRDPETDIAVIKINAKGLPAAKLGDSDKIKVGEWVLAIGNPFGLQHTVTAGIISAVGRSNIGIAQYEDFIQTDASINPGNSGGPLVNLNGEVIGINTAIFTKSGGYTLASAGVGFAIPINMAQKIMEQLIEKGKIVRGWLGVTIQNLNKELAESLGLKQTKGVVVRQVEVGSPADKAGIKSNDIILKVDGKQIDTSKQLMQIIAELTPGMEIEIAILRGNKEISKKVKIVEKQPLQNITEKKDSTELQETLGLEVKELTDELAQQYNLKGQKGVIITSVLPNSLAERAELQVGDLITEINGYPVKNIDDYRKATEKIEEKKSIEFSCIRSYMGRQWRFTTRIQVK